MAPAAPVRLAVQKELPRELPRAAAEGRASRIQARQMVVRTKEIFLQDAANWHKLKVWMLSAPPHHIDPDIDEGMHGLLAKVLMLSGCYILLREHTKSIQRHLHCF